MRRRPRVVRQAAAVCAKCGEMKPAADFVNDRTRASGRYPWCKACVSGYRREARHARVVGVDGARACPVCGIGLGGTHPNRRFCSDRCKSKFRRLEVFGLTPREYDALVESMGGRCPICQRRVKKWNLDHDHTTGITLGVVCARCNVGLLAFSNHDEEVVARLLEFLRNPPLTRLLGERRYTGPEAVPQVHRMWLWSEVEK